MQKTLRNHLSLVVLLLTAAPFFLLRLPQSPYPWFDEGLNLLAVRTLAETGQYGLPAASGLRLSDTAIQTGLPVLAVLTGLYQLFGPNIWVMRLVTVIFGMAALTALYALAQRMDDRFTAFLAIFLLLVMPVFEPTAHIIPMSRQVLGEIPAIFCLTLGLLILTRDQMDWRHDVLTGLCFGLAVAIKSQVLLVLSATIALWLLYSLLRQREVLRQWVVIAVVMGAIYILDSAWRLMMAGEHSAENTTILLQGIRIHLLPLRFASNLRSLTTLFFLGTAVIAVVGAFARRRFTSQPQHPAVQRVEWFLMLFVSLWMIWYGFVSIGWTRYAFIGHVFSLLLLAPLGAWVWRMLRLPNNRITYAAQLAVAAVLMLVFQLPLIQDQQGDQFYEAVDYVKSNIPPDAVIASWDLPLAYLVNQSFEFPTTDVTHEITANLFNQTNYAIDYDALTSCPDYLLYGSFAVDRQVMVIEGIGEALFRSGPYELYPVEQPCTALETSQIKTGLIVLSGPVIFKQFVSEAPVPARQSYGR